MPVSRALILSNAPWVFTGYGVQTALMIRQLRGLGITPGVTAFYGLQGAPINWNGTPVFPGGFDLYGNDVLVADTLAFKADILISLMDVWVLSPEQTKQVKWVPQVPIDHDPVTPSVREHLQTALMVLAMSEFGKAALEAAGFENVLYVPHAVDTDVYTPVDRQEARGKLGAPQDKFLIGMVAANKGAPSRKAFEANFRAFKRFHEAHPDAMLCLHTDRTGRQGEDLLHMARVVGLELNSVAFPDAYEYDRGMLGSGYMNNFFNACDVLLHTTRGEGFGVAQIESMSAGTPVISTDFSAMPEIVKRGAGWLVQPEAKLYTPQGSYQVQPSVDGIVARLEEAYAARGNADLREQARRGMLEHYAVDVVRDKHWKPAMDAVSEKLERISKRAPVKAKRNHRKERRAEAVAVQ